MLLFRASAALLSFMYDSPSAASSGAGAPTPAPAAASASSGNAPPNAPQPPLAAERLASLSAPEVTDGAGNAKALEAYMAPPPPSPPSSESDGKFSPMLSSSADLIRGAGMVQSQLLQAARHATPRCGCRRRCVGADERAGLDLPARFAPGTTLLRKPGPVPSERVNSARLVQLTAA